MPTARAATLAIHLCVEPLRASWCAPPATGSGSATAHACGSGRPTPHTAVTSAAPSSGAIRQYGCRKRVVRPRGVVTPNEERGCVLPVRWAEAIEARGSRATAGVDAAPTSEPSAPTHHDPARCNEPSPCGQRHHETTRVAMRRPPVLGMKKRRPPAEANERRRCQFEARRSRASGGYLPCLTLAVCQSRPFSVRNVLVQRGVALHGMSRAM